MLDTDPGCVKALYRRAQAHLGAQDFVEAEVDIRAALQVRCRCCPPCVATCAQDDASCACMHPPSKAASLGSNHHWQFPAFMRRLHQDSA